MAENGDILQENGDISSNNRPGMNNKTFSDQVKVQRLLNEAQKFREDLAERLNKDFEEYFETFISDVENITISGTKNNVAENSPTHSWSSYQDTNRTKRQNNEMDLPDKVFVTRRSLLTDLFEISHIRSIYHIFVAILIIFSFNTCIMDIIEKGSLGLDFGLIQWGLGQFPRVISLWMTMQLSSVLIIYPGFYYWAIYRPEGKSGVVDMVAAILYLVYQLAFFAVPIWYIIEHQLPPASAVIVTTEQIRFMMKCHAFVRGNLGRVVSYNSKDNKDHTVADMCPDFSKYLYFLFAPTLVYRDSYPQTSFITWSYVVSNFAQVVACLLYTYYIFERFCVPLFQNFNQDHITSRSFLVSVFGCMLPGTLVLLIGFFAILHSWFNAFAEMLRFGDRMFYKDWWNTTSFSSFYRTWNIVVHDWLYTYVYKDFNKILGPKYRGLSMAFVFLISAVFHEYVLVMALGFFYPVLFVMFAGAGFAFIFVKGKARSWNIFLWMALFMGMGLLLCLYSMEWYARKNCPQNFDSFLNLIIPRSWTTCEVSAST